MKTIKATAVSICGLITAIFFSLSAIADFFNTTDLAIMIFGNHTPAEWNNLAVNNFRGGGISLVITAFVYLILYVFRLIKWK